MKLALILNVINPKIGGVLLRGEKGTAKSLTVRALANLLPETEAVADCAFHCDPNKPKDLCDNCAAKLALGEKLAVTKRSISVVELPVGATEDRLVGTLDIEKAIKTGEKHFDPGILAQANRNILYIDEVNLLDDHLVDVLLDAAAMGMNYVQREGIAFTHPAQFVLIGTMNPEEGELRPQLLDRFALSVEVKGIPYKEARAEIVRRRIAYETDPIAFMATQQQNQEVLRQKIGVATALLSQVKLAPKMLDLITQISTDFSVDGHRADITMYKTACTIAAFNGRIEVTEQDVKEAAELVLPHRQRRQPFEQPNLEQDKLQESIQKWDKNQREQQPQTEPPQNNDNQDQPQTQQKEQSAKEQVFQAEKPYSVKPFAPPVLDEIQRCHTGRRSKTLSCSKKGRYVDSKIPVGPVDDLAFDATLRAAAPYQKRRKQESCVGTALLLENCDLRQKIRESKMGNLIVFVVDASGSMAAQQRMSATKGAVLSLLLDAYQRRDRVGMIAFRRETAELVLPPTNSVDLAEKFLSKLPTGGRTPMAHGLKLGVETIKNYMRGDREAVPLLVLVSDGRANVNLHGGDPFEEAKMVARQVASAGIQSVVLDTEQDFLSFGLVKQISDAMGGKYMRLEELSAAPIALAVRSKLFEGVHNGLNN
ncbi:MAG: putative cobaltochelatase [Candidatus Bathyarchaeia archaeon]|jgi:magnesium chelatase subunit D